MGKIQTNEIYSLKRFLSADFEKTFMKSIKDYFLDVGEIEENSNFLMKKNIGKKKTDIIGCKRTCPFCKSKCIKLEGEHQDHEAIHIINGFGGCRYLLTKEISLKHCFNPVNMSKMEGSLFNNQLLQNCVS